MATYKYIIVGGGIAGGKAVEGIREHDKEGSILLITQELHRPYQRPPLSKGYLVGERSEDAVYFAEPSTYEKGNNTLIQGVRVTEVDPESGTVSTDSGDKFNYEKLLLATGGEALRLPIEGADLSGVFTLRTIEDSNHIREAAGPGKQALILGGSFIGSEVAAGLSMMGSDVTMVFPEERLLERIVPRPMSEFLHQMYATHNIRILTETTPDRFYGGSHVEQVQLSNGAMPNVDMVVMGVGIRLRTELAREAGLDLQEEDDAIVVNEYLQTNDPHIYAAGDIASWPAAHFDKRLRVEHWDVARAQGLQAGRNMAGAQERYDILPYFFSDLFDLSFEVWGDLSEWEETVLRGSLENRNAAFYYFRDGQLVGVLAMGRPDEEREPMQTLVKKRPHYDDIAETLKDESSNLGKLVDNV